MTAAGIFAHRSVLVCAGPGGVGKTSVAAAVGAGLAGQGLDVAVITIDPARRLAGSLGLAGTGDAPQRVDPDRLAAAGFGAKGGELWAMTLDPKRTWDALIDRYAPDATTREAILGNRVYRELSSAVAGSQEYMAMEKLYELHESGAHDVVVLDTPPTRNALDFLDAPGRLLSFLDSRALALLTGPSRLGLRLASRGTGAALSLLERVTGVDLLRDVGDFLRSFEAMAGDFRARAARVQELLREPGTAFLAVSSPGPESVEEVALLARTLERTGMSFAAAVVNRVHPAPANDVDLDDELSRLLDPELAAKVAASAHELRVLGERDLAGAARLAAELGAARLISIPELDDDVHDLDGLAQLAKHLFA